MHTVAYSALNPSGQAANLPLEQQAPHSLRQRVGGLFQSCSSYFSRDSLYSLGRRSVTFIKDLGPGAKFGGAIAFGAIGAIYVVYGFVGVVSAIMAQSPLDGGKAVLVILAGSFQTGLSFRVTGPLTTRMVENPTEMGGSILGGSSGIYIARTVAGVAFDTMNGLPSLAASSLSFAIQGCTAIGAGALSTALSIALLKGAVGIYGRLKNAYCPPEPPPAEIPLVPIGVSQNV